MARNQNPGALMNIEIGGKWTFIPPKYGNFIGFDPSPHRGTKLLRGPRLKTIMQNCKLAAGSFWDLVASVELGTASNMRI